MIPGLKTCQVISNLLANSFSRCLPITLRTQLGNWTTACHKAPILLHYFVSVHGWSFQNKMQKICLCGLPSDFLRAKLQSATEQALKEDLEKLNYYIKRWRLCQIVTKTEVCLHPSNQQANENLLADLKSMVLNHNINSKYLGITLDWSLTFR